MNDDQASFGYYIFLGILGILPVACILVCKGVWAFLVYAWNDAKKNRAKQAAQRAAEAAWRAEHPEPRRESSSRKKSDSNFWEGFAAWNTYCYEEHVRNDQIYRGLL